MGGADAPVGGIPEKAERARAGTLVDKVHAELRGRIRRGEFLPDSKLPGEHSLAALFSVSRPVIRDVLERLREERLVYSRQGAGSFVQTQAHEPDALGFTPMESIADIQRCYEFRLTIEPDAAFLAASRRNAAAVERIAEALALLQEATSHHLHREDADFSFHKAITEASNNHYYVSSIDALKQHISIGMHFHGLSLLRGKPSLKAVLEEHRAIYHAVRDGKADEAREAMRRIWKGRATACSRGACWTCRCDLSVRRRSMQAATAPDALSAIIGGRYVIGPCPNCEPFLTDWRGRYPVPSPGPRGRFRVLTMADIPSSQSPRRPLSEFE